MEGGYFKAVSEDGRQIGPLSVSTILTLNAQNMIHSVLLRQNVAPFVMVMTYVFHLVIDAQAEYYCFSPQQNSNLNIINLFDYRLF